MNYWHSGNHYVSFVILTQMNVLTRGNIMSAYDKDVWFKLIMVILQ